MSTKNVVDVLRERGMLDATTNHELGRILERPVTVYGGFDPSAPSLQAGNLATIMVLGHFQRCGHKVIALVGGATGMIGDPSGKTSERAMLDDDAVRKNAEGIRENLSRFLDFNHPTVPAKIVNNSDWLAKFGFVEFLRDVGRHFRMGAMLGKESVKTRINSEAGMSFTEFSYQLLQAYDFLKLFDSEGCRLQIGGSDQWGNITAGIDLIRKLRNEEAYGLTIPLVCDSAGQKFGKSEGNAVYLDGGMTSVFKFYQFFLRTPDADAGRMLKIFTFLSIDEISALERESTSAPEKRIAQTRLACEVTRMVHGSDGLQRAQRASDALFGGAIDGMCADDLLEVFADVPSSELPRQAVENKQVLDVALAAGFCRSKGEGRRLLESGGFYVNNVRVENLQATIAASALIDGRLLVLRSGKKTYHLVRVV